MNAFAAELSRLLSRRLLKVLLLLVVVGFVIAGVVVFANSSPDVERLVPPAGIDAPDVVVDDRYHLTDFADAAEGITILLAFVFLLIGAMSIGAEWPNRSITASLTFEPRREVLLTAKLVAAALVAFVGTILLEFVLLLCMLPATFLAGTTEGADATWWFDLFGTFLRAGALSVFDVALGFSIATIGRNTGAALGVAFLYSAILEQLLRVWKPEWAEWLIGDNMAIVATGDGQEVGHEDRTAFSGAVVLMIYGAVVYALALWFFKRRDIA